MNTIMLLDAHGMLQYSVFFCAVLVAVFVLGFKLGQGHGEDE